MTVVSVRGMTRSVTIEGCLNVRVLIEQVTLGVFIVDCRNVEVVVGESVRRISVDRSAKCDLTLCADLLDAEIISKASAGVVVLAVPLQGLSRPVLPADLLNAPNKVLLAPLPLPPCSHPPLPLLRSFLLFLSLTGYRRNESSSLRSERGVCLVVLP
eukprot:758048-Hanusia_phi.AAC.3